MALRDTLIEEPLLYLCDNQSLLNAVNRWIGEGGQATFVGAPGTDILAAAIELLLKRIAAGTGTLLVKVKAHRGEPTNESADILADNAMSDPEAVVPMDESSNLFLFVCSIHVEKPVPRDRESNSSRLSFNI